MESAVQHRVMQQAGVIGQGSWLRPRRIDQDELLDLNAGTLDDVRANLREMWLINRWLGGLSALTTQLFPLLLRESSPITVLDLGTGGAEIPNFVSKWANKRGIQLQIVGADWSARNLSIADKNIGRQSNIHLLRADALGLPLAENSVDYVMSSLFMHHFTPDALIELLRKSYRAARHGIIMSDLVRGWLPLAAFKLISPIFARHWLTRHDGALSIYRAYTSDELRLIAHQAGLPHVRIYRHWPWRMTLIAEKTGPS